MKNNLIKIILMVLLVSSMVFAGCNPQITKTDEPITKTSDLIKINGATELRTYLKENVQNGGFYGGPMYKTLGAGVMVDVAASGASEMARNSATDYSTTNIQVEGVDEADFMKNDNKYIYMIKGQKLIILDAFPAKDAKILSTTELKDYSTELLLNGNKLIIFSNGNEETYSLSDYDLVPRKNYNPVAKVVIYDMSDKSSPKLEKEFSTKGYYMQSRMIGDYIYFLSNQYQYQPLYAEMPMIKESGRIAFMPPLYRFDGGFNQNNIVTVASIDLNGEKINAKSFLTSGSDVLYVSKDNIYITHPKNNYYGYNPVDSEKRFFEVILPVFPSSVRDEINTVWAKTDLTNSEKWERINNIVENMFNNMDEKAKADFSEKVQKKIDEYDIEQQKDRLKTVIHKIKINNGDIDYDTKGEVAGSLLDQFSLDEYNSNLRVATTTFAWGMGKSEMYSNVFVLDSGMSIVGKIEDIAPEEKIYSTRFMGDKLFMVTYKQVDPFFVIDLSAPTNPKILGELKIPGFSEYLQPFNDHLIVGIGKDTTVNEYGGTVTNGMKVSVFDVTDFSNPKELSNYKIGYSGTYSDASYDHKAVLLNAEKNLLVLPIIETGERYYNEKLGYYTSKTNAGAYVFTINEQGVFKKGYIDSEAKDDQYGWLDSQYYIKRSLFMDDVLYTVSLYKIMMHDLNNMNKVNEVVLPDTYDYPQPVLYDTPVAIVNVK